ncbi:hypothetical protein [Sulfitobacter sp. 1A15106]|uniref:hypothetical protein n=1 Tax=Sulfitobacter sp. 1A15106 TaxID=3368590 RepID=UPI003747103C
MMVITTPRKAYRVLTRCPEVRREMVKIILAEIAAVLWWVICSPVWLPMLAVQLVLLAIYVAGGIAETAMVWIDRRVLCGWLNQFWILDLSRHEDALQGKLKATGLWGEGLRNRIDM